MLIPKQVKCIKSEGSFVAEHTYYVSLTGCVFWASGNQSCVYWTDSMFEPIYTNEELLEYAAKMYPVGTEYRCASDNEVRKAVYLPRMHRDSVEVGIGFVYLKRTNTWAEIISTPEKGENFLTELSPWRDLTGYEVMNTVTGEKSKITSHQKGGTASLENGDTADLHNRIAPHSMVNKNWRVFDKAPTKGTPLDECRGFFKVGNIIRSVRGNKVLIEEKHLPFYEEDGKVYAAYDGILLYKEGVYAAYVGDTEPIKPEPKFKEGDFVICSSMQSILDFKIVGCIYHRNTNDYVYLLSSPSFKGSMGCHIEPFIYGESPGTPTCWWACESDLTLDTARTLAVEGTVSNSTDSFIDKSFVDMLKDAQISNTYKQYLTRGVDFANQHERSVTFTRHHQDLAKFVQDSEYDLMWGNLLEVPPLRVSRKNIKK
jgi:hypothetical protein